jgi:hypothetical protein
MFFLIVGQAEFKRNFLRYRFDLRAVFQRGRPDRFSFCTATRIDVVSYYG